MGSSKDALEHLSLRLSLGGLIPKFHDQTCACLFPVLLTFLSGVLVRCVLTCYMKNELLLLVNNFRLFRDTYNLSSVGTGYRTAAAWFGSWFGGSVISSRVV